MDIGRWTVRRIGIVLLVMVAMAGMVVAEELLQQDLQEGKEVNTFWNTLINEIQIIIAVIIAVVGWAITHILSIRAQNKNFLNQVYNSSRIEIIQATRSYQEWLTNVYAGILSLDTSYLQEDCDFLRQQLIYIGPLIINVPSDWRYRLEEYEILFPNTAEFRDSMHQRQGVINRDLSSFYESLKDIMYSEIEHTSKAKTLRQIISNFKCSEEINSFFYHQTSLLQDFQIYPQNVCLSSFTGNKIPDQERDPSCPRLVEDKRGSLKIVFPKEK